jgi:hypothetical protein
MSITHDNVGEFANLLQQEGFDARHEMLDAQDRNGVPIANRNGVTIGPKGLDQARWPPDTKAIFFPVAELNEPANVSAVERRDFLGIFERRNH